jgi:hypothetical protein
MSAQETPETQPCGDSLLYRLTGAQEEEDRHGRATDSISRGPGADLGSGICAADVDGVFVRWISIP